MDSPIEVAVSFFGSQSQLARKLGVNRSTVNSWIHGRNRIPAEKAVSIEKLTNSLVTRNDLRPDLFNQ